MKDVTSNVACIPIPPGHVDMFWDRVAPLLEPSIRTAKGRYEIDDIYESIMSGAYLLWLVVIDDDIVAAVITRLIVYPQCRGMAIDWVGGKRMKEWLPVVMDAMVTHSKHNDCTHIEGYGRGAWAKWIAKYGWGQEYTAFRMEV